MVIVTVTGLEGSPLAPLDRATGGFDSHEVLFKLSRMLMKANVYIDGFNLYYGIKKWPECKWLDLEALAKLLFPSDTINRIRYFTAPVKGIPDPQSRVRQNVFLRVLRDNPIIQIHMGRFLVSKVYRRLVNPPSIGLSPYAEVWKTEEKGSDVNLATYLLVDAINHDCDMAIVFSNDSDLKDPSGSCRSHPSEFRFG